MKTIKLELRQEVNDSGQLIIEYYWLNGNLHNAHGAAYRRWNGEGVLVTETYSLNGKYHNEHGPAIRSWYGSGELWREQYRLNGELLTKEEWQSEVSSDSCLGKVITVDGRQYKLEAVQ